MYLESLTRRELEAVSRECVAVLPLGSCEQHGAHLSFGIDNLILRRLVEQVETRLSERALWLPALPYAHSGRHRAYPGSVSFPIALYIEAAAAVLDSMAEAGFTKALMLNGQRGNEAPMENALRILRDRRAGFAAVGVSYWNLLDKAPDEGFVNHAGGLETSLALFLAPEHARMEHAVADGVRRASPYSAKTVHYARIDQQSRSGGLGDPENASAKLGKKAFHEAADRLAELIDDLHDGLIAL